MPSPEFGGGAPPEEAKEQLPEAVGAAESDPGRIQPEQTEANRQAGAKLLAQRFSHLAKSEALGNALRREKMQTGTETPPKFTDRVEIFLGRLDQALERHPQLFERLVREDLLRKYPLKLNNPDGSENCERVEAAMQAFLDSENSMRNVANLEPEQYEQVKNRILELRQEQTQSLDIWITYLSSEDARGYPTWFKYLTLMSLGDMGKRDRDAARYGHRGETTLAPFPDRSSEALAKTLDAIKQYQSGALQEMLEEAGSGETESLRALEKLARRVDFSGLYARFQNGGRTS